MAEFSQQYRRESMRYRNESGRKRYRKINRIDIVEKGFVYL